MQYIKKSKVPLSVWILLIVVFVSIIALITLHFVGIIDLSFLAAWFIGTFAWAGSDIVNAVLLSLGIVTGTILIDYAIRKYIIGTKMLALTTQPSYDPRGTTLSQTPPQNKDEVTVKA